MARNETKDLNNYERIDKPEDFNCLTIILQTPEGHDPKDYTFHYIKKNRKNLVESPEGVIWHRNIKIHQYGTSEEYGALVDWWFDEMMEDVEYKETLNAIAKNVTSIPNALPLKGVIKNCREYVKGLPKSKRYSDLKKYLDNRVSRLTKYWLGWSDAKRKWEIDHTYRSSEEN